MQLTSTQLETLGHQVIALTGLRLYQHAPGDHRVQLAPGFNSKTPMGLGAVVMRLVEEVAKTQTKRFRITMVPRVEHDKDDPTGRLALFYLDEFNELTCYASLGEHSPADLGYYRTKTRPVHPNTNQAKTLFQRYCSIPGGEGCEFVLGSRLTKPRRL